MAAIHDVGGYTIALEKIYFISRVFEAPDNQGAQFNVKLSESLLKLRFPDRATAVLEREGLVEALREA